VKDSVAHLEVQIVEMKSTSPQMWNIPILEKAQSSLIVYTFAISVPEAKEVPIAAPPKA
jgi:hypothetical protein